MPMQALLRGIDLAARITSLPALTLLLSICLHGDQADILGALLQVQLGECGQGFPHFFKHGPPGAGARGA